eukprot:XP_001695662.1 predicted protein [Chlamydomonas reinhardtii]
MWEAINAGLASLGYERKVASVVQRWGNLQAAYRNLSSYLATLEGGAPRFWGAKASQRKQHAQPGQRQPPPAHYHTPMHDCLQVLSALRGPPQAQQQQLQSPHQQQPAGASSLLEVPSSSGQMVAAAPQQHTAADAAALQRAHSHSAAAAAAAQDQLIRQHSLQWVDNYPVTEDGAIADHWCK